MQINTVHLTDELQYYVACDVTLQMRYIHTSCAVIYVVRHTTLNSKQLVYILYIVNVEWFT